MSYNEGIFHHYRQLNHSGSMNGSHTPSSDADFQRRPGQSIPPFSTVQTSSLPHLPDSLIDTEETYDHHGANRNSDVNLERLFTSMQNTLDKLV